MSPERDPFQAVLESLADGTEVDWAALDSSASTSAERRRYRNLRLVARVAELHRTLTLDEEETGAGEIETATATPAEWGHLQVGERLASGAYGEIHIAHDPQLNRDVALKILRPGVAGGRPVEQLLREARTLAKVHHPNVVTIHGADVRDGRAGLWMELVHGQTLEAWLHAHGTMGGGEASALGVDVCRALAAVHAAGLVHGDVKAQNVMRENGGRIVLMDFGAGRAQGAEAVGVAGTPLYLAPEVLAGEPPTLRSDIYSVGVLLFHLLTGAYPYSAGDIEGLRAAHADGVRTWLRDLRPDLPDPLTGAIERALEPDPARRFASAGEMERALAQVPQREAAEPTRARGRSRARGFAIAAAAFFVVIAALIVWSRTGESRRGVALGKVRTIGVMPMINVAGPMLPGHFATGLNDELLSTLAQIEGLTVKPVSAQNEQRSLKDIARALDVDALLQTTVSTTSEQSSEPGAIKVRARLIAAGTQGIVWSRDFDRPRGATLELPGAIASALAGAVRSAITHAGTSRLAETRRTDPAAEDAYLQGRALLDQYGGGSAQRALEAFQRALQIDSSHAAAHVGAARAYIALGLGAEAIPPTRARAEAQAELNRALSIAPDLPEAHMVLARLLFFYDWNWPGAEREYRRSLDLSPNSPYTHYYYAENLAALGRFDDAVGEAEAARQVDPQSGAAVRRHALVLYYKRDLAGAQRALDEAEAIEPNHPSLAILRSRLLEVKGSIAEALDLTTTALQLSSGGGVPLETQRVRQLALAGRRDEALAHLRELQIKSANRVIHLSARDLAYIHLAMGDARQALAFFEAAVFERDPTLVWLGVDPRVDALRSEPRFQRILSDIGLH